MVYHRLYLFAWSKVPKTVPLTLFSVECFSSLRKGFGNTALHLSAHEKSRKNGVGSSPTTFKRRGPPPSGFPGCFVGDVSSSNGRRVVRRFALLAELRACMQFRCVLARSSLRACSAPRPTCTDPRLRPLHLALAPRHIYYAPSPMPSPSHSPSHSPSPSHARMRSRPRLRPRMRPRPRPAIACIIIRPRPRIYMRPRPRPRMRPRPRPRPRMGMRPRPRPRMCPSLALALALACAPALPSPSPPRAERALATPFAQQPS